MQHSSPGSMTFNWTGKGLIVMCSIDLASQCFVSDLLKETIMILIILIFILFMVSCIGTCGLNRWTSSVFFLGLN
jgi:hypothetical protein